MERVQAFLFYAGFFMVVKFIGFLLDFHYNEFSYAEFRRLSKAEVKYNQHGKRNCTVSKCILSV